jgi:S1-C subfamily serine protease
MIGISLIEESNSERKNNAVKVGYIVPNSPAEKSGIKINDILIKVGNKDIETASDVIDQISKNGINKQINILVKRQNKLIKLKVIPTDITNLQNN